MKILIEFEGTAHQCRTMVGLACAVGGDEDTHSAFETDSYEILPALYDLATRTYDKVCEHGVGQDSDPRRLAVLNLRRLADAIEMAQDEADGDSISLTDTEEGAK